MKKLLSIVVLALFGMVGVGKTAGIGWITTASSAVFVTTSTDIEITDVQIGTGSNVLGDVYVVIVDSSPLHVNNPITNEALMNGVTFTEANFPISQWVTPPIIAITTSSAVNSPGYFQSLETPSGEGREIQHGLCIFVIKNSALGSTGATKVTVGYRKRVNRWGR